MVKLRIGVKEVFGHQAFGKARLDKIEGCRRQRRKSALELDIG